MFLHDAGSMSLVEAVVVTLAIFAGIPMALDAIHRWWVDSK